MAGSRAFDELWGTGGRRKARAGLEPLAEWVRRTPKSELSRRQQAAEAAFRSLGITFAVYGEEEAAERIIPFDIVPRIFTAAEWARLSAGLEQRVQAINAFIDDVYGPRRILSSGVIPPEIVLANPQYCVPVAGARAPHGVYAHICGIDLVRTGADDFWVLEDNARTPSGVSYMLENRDAMMRLCPELFDAFPVCPVDLYPEQLRDMLYSVAPGGKSEPTCVLLTPGHYNSAFYEHSFLADNMGIELVEGRDLVVDDDCVFMRTIDGPVKVDVIYRRVDDAFLDPLIFRPDSALGVPGLMAAYLAGNVTLVNAPGTGIADDKAIYSYMPEIVRYYAGEEPKLPNVETWRCREPDALQYTLDNLETLVVKLVDGSGGYGMLVGPTASRQEIEDFRAALKAEPQRYIAQPTLALSTVPTFTDAGIAPRHVDFRPFVLTGADRIAITPGGLTRVALREGSLVVNSSQGGGTKDSFVLLEDRPAGGRRLMLARTAANLYWIGRLMERAEFTARLVEATIRLNALGDHGSASQAWRSALAVVGALDAFRAGGETLTALNARRYLTLADANPGSIRSCIAVARDNARAARTALSVEVWEAINRAWLLIRDRASPGGAQQALNLLDNLKAEIRGYEGALGRMLHVDGSWFVHLGAAVERGDNTARLIDVKYYLLLPPGQEVGGVLDRDQWTTILQIVSARTAYRHIYREGLKPWLVADFLIFRDEMPRSLTASAQETVRILGEFAAHSGRQGPADRLARQRLAKMEGLAISAVVQTGLHEWLHRHIAENAALDTAIAQQFRFP